VNDKQLTKIVAAAYDRVLARNNGHATRAEVFKEALEEVAALGLGDHLIAEIADNAVEKEDKRRIAQGNDSQLDLLSGEEAAFEGLWALGDGRRVQKKHVVEDDYVRHLKVAGKSFADHEKSWRKDQREATELLPHMRGGKVTLPQAVASWREVNGKQ
jgi:hypothetical protein